MKKTTRSALFSLLFLGAPAFLLAQDAQDYRQMGEAVAQQGLYAKAVQYYQQAVAADPNDWQSYQDMGDAYMKMNDSAEALGAYQKSLQINPNNSAAQAQVNSLTASGVQAQAPAPAAAAPPSGGPAASSPSNPPGGQFSENQPMEQDQDQTIVIRHRHRRPEPVINYNDNLAPMDHAKMWFKWDFGYNYSLQEDLINSANATNAEAQNGTLFYGFNKGNATMSNSGFSTGGEIGFLVNPNFGIGIGARYIQGSTYTLSAENTNTPSTYPEDFEDASFTPEVVPITLDLYLFMPDHDGRFFISAGAGYYWGVVNVNENYSLTYYEGNSSAQDNPVGNLYAGNVGFQVGVGRDFAIGRNFGISIFARGRYCQISGFQGTLSDGNNYALVKYSDGTVDIDNPANVGSGGEKYAVIDFTGFDAGISLNWFSL